MDIKEENVEIENNLDIFQKYLGFSAKTFLLMVSFVIVMGIYIGIILYGKNSITVLTKLQAYESYLKDDIDKLKQQNAELQKEYFELKEISGEK